jgi:hypothetical protein
LSASGISDNIKKPERARYGRRGMTNYAKVGGVLSIVAGALGFIYILMIFGIMALVTVGYSGAPTYDHITRDEGYAFLVFFLIVLGVFYAAMTALAIAGGVFALKKVNWGWALAGAIGGTLIFFPCGIPAIVFVSLGKPEFQASAPPPAAPAPTIVG